MKALIDKLDTHNGRLAVILGLLGLNHLHHWWNVDLLGWGLVLVAVSLLWDKK